ncbi:MAG TPA: 16S rRNA (guanine(527)-N(7))-methyltransferase RsmG [Verrucomicrobiae bacterium]|nr:16S rRNA (guanine(527)-N(7))-methyltransferase RsmG [Verrucomicrobiae bacterium]
MEYGPEDFAAATGVSRETIARLSAYAALLVKWQARINLVSASTLGELWRRHLLDSAQLLPLLPEGTASLIDLGSGAGFPGLVLAILGIPEVHLIESDQRKCVFLAEAARAAGVKPFIHNKRIEQLEGLSASVVTARACAPLDLLLTYAQRFLWHDGKALFLKGAAAEEELAAARKNWQMEVERFPSASDPTGCILRIGQVQRARQ